MSKRLTRQMMDDVFGVPMSVGTISPLEQATTAAVATPVEEARTYVHKQAVAHLDETSWRQGGKHAWLWVAVTSWVTVFLVRLSRGGPVARALLAGCESPDKALPGRLRALSEASAAYAGPTWW